MRALVADFLAKHVEFFLRGVVVFQQLQRSHAFSALMPRHGLREKKRAWRAAAFLSAPCAGAGTVFTRSAPSRAHGRPRAAVDPAEQAALLHALRVTAQVPAAAAEEGSENHEPRSE